MIYGANKGDRYLLAPGSYRIGRTHECNIRLDDDQVSSEHAIVEVAGVPSISPISAPKTARSSTIN
ncbi:MAG: FHA domain-containing protein [Deltaproteobacteria bacterium]|nr:FHA domain-containing protein [Deltaproteobacteria bacterium]